MNLACYNKLWLTLQIIQIHLLTFPSLPRKLLDLTRNYLALYCFKYVQNTTPSGKEKISKGTCRRLLTADARFEQKLKEEEAKNKLDEKEWRSWGRWSLILKKKRSRCTISCCKQERGGKPTMIKGNVKISRQVCF